jgi:hypothetical protein
MENMLQKVSVLPTSYAHMYTSSVTMEGLYCCISRSVVGSSGFGVGAGLLVRRRRSNPSEAVFFLTDATTLCEFWSAQQLSSINLYSVHSSSNS